MNPFHCGYTVQDVKPPQRLVPRICLYHFEFSIISLSTLIFSMSSSIAWALHIIHKTIACSCSFTGLHHFRSSLSCPIFFVANTHGKLASSLCFSHSASALASPALVVEISVASQDLAAALECLVRIGHPQDLRIGDLHTCHRLGYPRQELLHLSFHHGWVDPMLLWYSMHLRWSKVQINNQSPQIKIYTLFQWLYQK